MTETQFKNLLAFCVLMAGDSIFSKSPKYIIEKASRYLDLKSIKFENEFDWGLHPTLKRECFETYCVEWQSHIKALNEKK